VTAIAGRSRLAAWMLPLVLGWLAPSVEANAEPIRVGIVVDGPWVMNELVRELTVREVTALTAGEFDVQFPTASYLIGDWTFDTAQANVRRLLDDPEIDLVITWGLIASHAACCFGELSKPLIAPVVLDPELQGLPRVDGGSGVPNLNYVALPDDQAHELELFRDIVPFQHVAILASAALLDAIPEIVVRTGDTLAGTGIGFEYVAVGDSADAVLEALSPSVDAVYVWPLFQLSASEYRRLIDGFIARGLPSFSGLGGGDVEAGMLASLGSAEFFPKLARRIALNIQRILLGEEAGSLPVEFSIKEDLLINMATARAIDVSPRWEVLIEAEVLYADDLAGAYELSLDKMVAEVLALNLDLIVERRTVEAGAQEIVRARSSLRPQLEIGASSVVIDDDRAAASLGSQAERTQSASAKLSQLVYSEPVAANLAIQKRSQEGREQALRALELDLVLEAATSYLNLLRAKALERVQHNNVDRTRSNLEVAELRRDIGVASAGEVLRWQSEIATARKSLVDAVADRRSAEFAVNRLLHRPLDANFVTRDATLEALGLLSGQRRFQAYVETPKGYAIFSDFLVLEGLVRAPELARIDAAVAAQSRFVLSSRRAFWVPTVAFQASLDEILSRSGSGAELSFGLPFDLPRADDSSWSLTLNATLPIFVGGSRQAEETKAEIDLERLALERAAGEERIEQRIRTALEQARASFVGIRLADRAAGAARGNLALVEDAYARGAAALLDLLDAQTAALNAEEQAADALYDFLIDWLEAKRSASALDLFVDRAAHSAWLARLDAYLESQGVAAPPTERS